MTEGPLRITRLVILPDRRHLAAEPGRRLGERQRGAGGLDGAIAAKLYERIDAPANSEQKKVLKSLTGEKLAMKELAGEPVRAALTAAPGNKQSFGGIKVVTDSGWFAARPSGTEDVYKIYAESFRSEAHLKDIQREAQAALAHAFGG